MAERSRQGVGVVGAGQMGSGIAHTCAAAGHAVTLSDVDDARAQAGKASIARRLEASVAKGKLTVDGRDAILARIACGGVDAAATAPLVVEAATENVDLKLELFARLGAVSRPGSILASNTSSISITRLASVTPRPDAVVGIHFMNPVPVMQLVELVRGEQTSDATLTTAEEFAEGLGKTTIVSKDVPGFVVNRVLIPMLNEACFALQEGVATAEDIDRGIQLGLNHPMGPLQLADLIGLDTVLAIAEVLFGEIGDDKYRPAVLLRNKVAAGWLGRKTGRGFYTYDAG